MTVQEDKQARAEYIELVKQSALKAADIARELGCSRASVSKTLAGLQTPRDTTLKLLRNVVARLRAERGENFDANQAEADRIRQGGQKKPAIQYPQGDEGLTGPASSAVRRASQKLSEIEEHDPAAFHTISEVIAVYHSKSKPKAAAKPKLLDHTGMPFSSAVEAAAKAGQAGAAYLAGLSGPESSPSPQAGGSTGHKPSPKRGTAAHSARKPGSPTKARE